MLEFVDYVLYSKISWIFFAIYLLYTLLRKTVYSYWERHGIPHDNFIVPTGIFGVDFLMNKISLGNLLKNSYEKFKRYPFHGIYMFHNKVLMINDPELIKNVLIKDFANFSGRGLFCNVTIDPISGGLFFLDGNEWRTMKAKLSPSFTAKKVKQMFPLLKRIVDELIDVTAESLSGTDILEMKDLFARYTTDSTFNLVFGVDSNCLRQPHNAFRYYGDLPFSEGIVRVAMGFFAPKLSEIFRVPMNHPETTKFFMKLFNDMVEKRRNEDLGSRNDILDSLVDLMDNEQVIDIDMTNLGINTENITKRLKPLEALAQAFIFFLGGFETTSSTLTHWIYELALNPDIQEIVYEEISELLKNPEDFNYDNLMQLEYFDLTLQETLRKHPSIPIINRICVKDYKIPDSDVTIPEGMRLVIAITGLHNNPDFYPEPQKFDPTRFAKQNISSRHPFAFLPFGEGPRICIGKQFSILVSKMAAFCILANFKFSVCEKTSIPIHYSSYSFTQTPRDGVHLKVEKRNGN